MFPDFIPLKVKINSGIHLKQKVRVPADKIFFSMANER